MARRAWRWSHAAATALLLALWLGAAATARAAASSSMMRPVRVIQARVQSDAPQWDAAHSTFVSSFGATFAEKYRAVFDSVNTASVEGALMYVQAEGINVRQNTECKRKNAMQYIVFYELHIVQPSAALDVYANDSTNLPEYGPFVAMDSGACTPTGAAGGPGDGASATLPKDCNAFFGGDGLARLGPSVGASLRSTDTRAPYPNAVWFSFPNSCVMKPWKEKASECRQQFTGGLCGYGSQPDGEICSFTYKTLGYIDLDDLVGITALTSSKTNAPYTNYTEFCLDKAGEYAGVEFSAVEGETSDAEVTSLPFWANPYDAASNQKRAQRMVELYNRVAGAENHMTALPSPAALAQENPPCHLNSPRCAIAEHGCKRELYAQVCRVCDRADEEGCVKASYDLKDAAADTPSRDAAGSESDSERGEAETDELVDGSFAAQDADEFASTSRAFEDV